MGEIRSCASSPGIVVHSPSWLGAPPTPTGPQAGRQGAASLVSIFRDGPLAPSVAHFVVDEQCRAGLREYGPTAPPERGRGVGPGRLLHLESASGFSGNKDLDNPHSCWSEAPCCGCPSSYLALLLLEPHAPVSRCPRSRGSLTPPPSPHLTHPGMHPRSGPIRDFREVHPDGPKSVVPDSSFSGYMY